MLYSTSAEGDVLSNPKQPSCKKECGPQKGYGDVKSKVAANVMVN